MKKKPNEGISVNSENIELIKQKNSLLLSILESPLGINIFSLDKKYRYTFFTDSHKQTIKAIWGADIEAGMNMLDIIGKPEDREKAKRNFDRVLKGESLVEVEEYGNSKLKRIKWENRYSPITDDKNIITGLTVFITDISERTRTEETLKENESRFRSYFELPLVGIAITSLTKGWLEVNSELIKMLGYSKNDLSNLTWADITYPEDLNADVEKFNRVIAGEINTYSMQKRFIRKNGEIIWTNLSVSCVRKDDGSVDYMVALLQDINKQKQTEEQLRKLNQAIEQSPATVVITDLNGDIEYVNPKFFETTGYTFEEAKGKNSRILKSGETTPTEYKELWETITHDKEWRGLFHNKKKNGELYWELATISPIRNEKGEIINYLAIKEDITKRKEAEDALRESEKKYRELTENMKDVVWVLDTETMRFTYISPSVEGLRGYTVEEIMAEPMDAALTPEAREGIRASIRKETALILAGGTSSEEFFLNEIEQPCKDGTTVWTEVLTRYKLNESTGKVEVHGVTRDISERKKSEKTLLENEIRLKELNATKDKFFSIIAHDLRSPFSSIMGFSNLLVDQIKDKDYSEIENYADIIQISSNRVMTLLTNLLEWSNAQTGRMNFNPEYVELVSLINEVIELSNFSANHKSVSINKILPRIAPVLADKAMISTVLRNLISNAIKYTNKGDTITVNAEQKSNEMIISVTDCGIGIEKNDIEKLFKIDKNFTTPGTDKEKGTGLGLILCKEFVERHGGKISVESTKGKGSKFSFTIPNR